MRKKTVLLAAVLSLIVGLYALPATAEEPEGQGANACHELYAGGGSGGGDQEIGIGKYNVGNPEQVLIAGDCDGGPISVVDDGLKLTVNSPNGNSGTGVWAFYNFCGGSNNGGAAIDVTDMFSPGTNNIVFTLTDDCGGGATYAPALYLVVNQHID
jgi:hypothetical protein